MSNLIDKIELSISDDEGNWGRRASLFFHEHKLATFVVEFFLTTQGNLNAAIHYFIRGKISDYLSLSDDDIYKLIKELLMRKEDFGWRINKIFKTGKGGHKEI